MKRLSPSMIVACVALVVALAGTSYAALKLPKNSVSAKQIKTGAVRSAEVKDGSLLGKDFAKGELPTGATGPQGPAGPPGAPNPSADTLDGVDSTELPKVKSVASTSFSGTLSISVKGLAYVALNCKLNGAGEGDDTIGLYWQNESNVNEIETGTIFADAGPYTSIEYQLLDGTSEPVGGSEPVTDNKRIAGTFGLAIPGTERAIEVQFGGSKNSGSTCTGHMMVSISE